LPACVYFITTIACLLVALIGATAFAILMYYNPYNPMLGMIWLFLFCAWALAIFGSLWFPALLTVFLRQRYRRDLHPWNTVPRIILPVVSGLMFNVALGGYYVIWRFFHLH